VIDELRRFPGLRWLARVIAAAALLSTSAMAQDPPRDSEAVVNVYNWADYIAPDTVAKFEKETGIRVNYDEYDSSETVEAKLLAGHSGYDVVMHAAQYSSRLLPIGVYQKLDRSRLTNWSTLDPDLLELLAIFDPGNLYAAPYMWGSTGFAYNVDMIRERMPDAPVDSGDMIFDPEIASRFADCGISFLDSPTDVIPLALVYLGYEANSTNPDEFLQAEKMLRRIRPYIRYFSSTRMISDLPNKELCIAMSWSGDYATARDRAREAGVEIDLAYSSPREGSLLWFDGMFIPSDAPHPDNAMLFIDFVLRPQNLADISNAISYANGSREARKFMHRELLEDPAVYPTQEIMDTLQPNKALPPKQERLRTRTWAHFKTGI
jgi:putrescine transport system substrate-binding protein